MEQNSGNYKPVRDSPLIGGWGNRVFVRTRVTKKGGASLATRRSAFINMLRTSINEFPKREVGFLNANTSCYDAHDVDAWLEAWRENDLTKSTTLLGKLRDLFNPPYLKTVEIIHFLEQAYKEFPVEGVFDPDVPIECYHAPAVNSWLRRWLMVPPSLQSLKGSTNDE